MAKRHSIQGVANKAVRDDARMRKALDSVAKAAKAIDGTPTVDAATADSFVNFAFNLGIGADNALSSAGYGFNPITRIRTLLEWMHRGSWVAGMAVDVVAKDMTRAGVEIKGDLKPEQIQEIDEIATHLGIWNSIREVIQWSRLYGGALGMMMIDGQDPETPLRIETIGKDAFRGMLVLDRWMVEPSLSNLVTELGPNVGLPKFYAVTADAPALPRMKIHYSRCLRLSGTPLPYWQRVMENLWGISVLERLYDRMVAFDSATTGAAQLVYRAHFRTIKIKAMRQIVSQGGKAQQSLIKYLDMMRRFQGIEGLTMLDAEDEFGEHQHSAFTGLSDALLQFGQQLSGALGIPLVRLYGQSPAGLNSTGESDLRMYYDTIKDEQIAHLQVPVTMVYRAIAQSRGIKLPSGFAMAFRPLWQLTEIEKGELATSITSAVTQAHDANLISDRTAMHELKQASAVTGVFSNITDEEIENAEELPVPQAELAMPGMEDLGNGQAAPSKAREKGGAEVIALRQAAAANKKRTQDDSGTAAVSAMKRIHDLDIVIENPKGSHRSGPGWEVVMPTDYGYIRKTNGADGDQVDCFVGPAHDSRSVWIIEQCDPDTKEYDEDKVLIGYGTMFDAMNDYVNSYSDLRGAERIRSVRMLDMDQFKEWLAEHQKRSGGMSGAVPAVMGG